jgi:integrase
VKNSDLSEVLGMAKTELLREGDLQNQQRTRGLIVEFALHLKKKGYADETVIQQPKLLRILSDRGADLYNQESVKETIANQSWCPGRRENAVDAYTNFLLLHGMSWDPPKYQRIQKIPFIPLEKEIDDLIAGTGRKTAAFLQLLKETGMRAGEAWNLEWTDVDNESKNVRITPEKGSNPRVLPLSNKCLAMLNALRKDRKRVFGDYPRNGFARSFHRQRKSLSVKLQNPRIQQISFHTFRHWKATMHYHKVRDLIDVMRLLGHKNIKNTMIYMHTLPLQEDDAYVSKVARTVEETCELVELGFEYVCDMENARIFKKRK